jgi:PAS domain S-box-containing protein
MLGYFLKRLRGQRFLDSFDAREHAKILNHLPRRTGSTSAPFTATACGSEREIAVTAFAIEMAGSFASVLILRDLTSVRAAARTAVVLAQTTAQLVGTGTTTNEILAGIARHAVEGTRALSAGIVVMGEGRTLSSGGGYGPEGPNYGDASLAWNALAASLGEEVIQAMTGGAICVGDVPGQPVVLSDARSAWEANPITAGFAATMAGDDWRAGVCVPLSWENQVFGVFGVYLPSSLPGPSETELAFYAALADQASVAVANARLTTEAGQTAALLERTRLARELHDSVSQALFSMTMHARAAQLSLAGAGLDDRSPLGHSIAQLAELTSGALAERRALIFELRPGALAEEGLVAAVRKHAAALTTRDDVAITVEGPQARLDLTAKAEEHLYRIVSDALHNVVKHARAKSAAVSIWHEGGTLRVAVTDNGCGFNCHRDHPGHLGLSTMAQRAEAIDADLAIATAPGAGTTVTVSFPSDLQHHRRRVPVPDGDGIHGDFTHRAVKRQGKEAVPVAPSPLSLPLRPLQSVGLADAAGLGVAALAEIVAGAQDGISVVDANQRYVYANPAACQMHGQSLQALRGQDFLGSFPTRQHPTMLDRFPDHLGDGAGPFTSIMLGPDGTDREVVCSTFAIEMTGRPHTVAILRRPHRAGVAARTAAALAQTASQLVAKASIPDVSTGIARHAVEGTRALSCGISVMNDAHQLVARGGYGPDGPRYGEANPAWMALTDAPVDEVIATMTGGSIVLGDVPGKPVVVPDARLVWEATPGMRDFATNLKSLDWQGAVCLPMSWVNRVFGFFTVFLPSGLAEPSEDELALYMALADQAAVAVTNAQLTSQARLVAALVERTRLARELHDSVSQALFSMTMHARAAQLSMAKAGVDQNAPLGRSITQLGDLARGAMAEMRALIFELRAGALAEEGLMGALRKQGAALTAREQTTVTVEGPDERLEFRAGIEEHLYRIVLEALHNVVKHAGATNAAVRVSQDASGVFVSVIDNGVGFDTQVEHPGHLGLSTMAERAGLIGGDLVLTSSPGAGTTVMLSLSPHRRDEDKGVPIAG